MPLACLHACVPCAQADRSIESLFAELVSNGILRPVPHVHVRDYLGSPSYVAATLEKANIIPDPSMAQVRHASAMPAPHPSNAMLCAMQCDATLTACWDERTTYVLSLTRLVAVGGLLSAQVRQALTEYCILPLGSQYIHERAPYVKVRTRMHACTPEACTHVAGQAMMG